MYIYKLIFLPVCDQISEPCALSKGSNCAYVYFKLISFLAEESYIIAQNEVKIIHWFIGTVRDITCS
jgi:hypothetical protein